MCSDGGNGFSIGISSGLGEMCSDGGNGFSIDISSGLGVCHRKCGITGDSLH